MNYDIFEFLFKYHRGAIAPLKAKENENVIDKKYVYSANIKLSQEGYTMSKELIEACLQTTEKNFMEFWTVISLICSEYRTLIEQTSPIWPNFPQDAMEADKIELYVANLLHFFTHGQWTPEFDIKKVAPQLIMPTASLKIIPAATEQSAIQLICELYTRNFPLSAQEIADISKIMKYEHIVLCVSDALKNKIFPCKESIALYIKDIYPFDKIQKDNILKQITNARDVLRIAAAMSEGNVSLSTKTRFKNFSRKERRFLLSLIENTSNIEQEMSKNREEWKRLGEKIHFGEYSKKFPQTFKAINLIRSNKKIETFESKLQKLMKKPVQIDELCQHMSERMGVYARNLDFTLRNCKDFISAYGVLSHFERFAHNVDTRILMQMINHFRNRSTNIKMAVAKKSSACAYIEKKEAEKIHPKILNETEKVLTNIICKQLLKENAPKIYIDCETLKDKKITFPINTRQISTGEKVYYTGSVLPLPENANKIRAFLYWKGDESANQQFIDLDLSVMFLNKSFECVNFVSFSNPSFKEINGIHSGDERFSGKNGAIEYVDFSLKKAQNNKVAYAMFTVNSYTGQMFSEIDIVFCGIMSRDETTGKQFEPQTVQTRFDLTSNSYQQASVLIDISNKKYMIVDKIISQRALNSHISQSTNEIQLISEYIVNDNSLTIEEVLNFTNRVVNSPEQADVIITCNNDDFNELEHNPQIINPWDTTAITQLIFDEDKKEI